MSKPKTDETLTPPKHLRDQLCDLPDGRKLSYAEFGDPLGYPVFYFHGFPGCRLEAWPHHRMLERKRIRLICPDRPGIGGSSPQQGRRYLDYPVDILHLADHLMLEKFAVLGASGGGPYGVACAKVIPAVRMSAVGLLAPAAPAHIEGQDGSGGEGLKVMSRLGIWVMQNVPSTVEAFVKMVIGVLGWLVSKQWVINRIDGWFERSIRSIMKDSQDDESDELLPAATQREQLLAVFHEEFKQGTKAVMGEANLLLQPWGYDLSDVSYDSIQIWHGSRDVNAPIAQSRLMAGRLPRAEMKEFDLDHHEMLAQLGMVLDDLVTDKMRQGV